MTRPLLTLRQAAAQAGVSYDRIWHAAKSGALTTIRFSPRGTYHIAPADLQAWITRHRGVERRLALPATAAPSLDDLQALLPAPAARRFS